MGDTSESQLLLPIEEQEEASDAADQDLVLNMGGIYFTLLDDICGTKLCPLLRSRINCNESISVKSLSTVPEVKSTIYITADFYNKTLETWEPVLRGMKRFKDYSKIQDIPLPISFSMHNFFGVLTTQIAIHPSISQLNLEQQIEE